MSRSALPLALLLVCGGLAACADADDPQLLSADGNGIAVRLAEGEDAMAQAVEVANTHCVSVRRVAVLKTVTEVEGARLAFFECVRV